MIEPTQHPETIRIESPVARPISRVGIIGAGTMGQGIALANLQHSIPVVLLDRNADQLRRAVAQIETQRAKFRPVSPSSPSHVLSEPATLTTSQQLDALRECDLVIEAIVERLADKQQLIAELDSLMPPGTILATNSSSIPVGELRRSAVYPGRLCGLHFCHPVLDRPLVEVIRAEQTSAETLDRAVQYARRIGKRPQIVPDSPGFVLNRLLVPYLNEALELLLDGSQFEHIEKVATDFGMPVGPLTHIDAFGIDVALAVGRRLFWTYPDRIVPSELLIAIYKRGRRDRNMKSGLVAIGADGQRSLAPEVQQLVVDRLRSDRRGCDPDQICSRLFLPMLVEATRTLDEKLVADAETLDQFIQDGMGTTDRYRGLFGWARQIGFKRIEEQLNAFSDLGERFQATSRLVAELSSEPDQEGSASFYRAA